MEAFINRLKKNDKHISKWAKRTGVTCYRIYDHDIPEFPFCIDRYEDFVYACEYLTTRRKFDENHDEWLDECKSAIIGALNVMDGKMFLKERKRLDRRNEQYEKTGLEKTFYQVSEGGLSFKVNFFDYLDTGLFLDHRPLRQVVKATVQGKKFLNLFSYTGSFSVYAAAGDALKVTTVDLSNTYLNWAKDNFKENNLLQEDKHVFVNSDVMKFLKNHIQEPTYDIVFVDPPSFSNSKKMEGVWDTQRDHAEMLSLILPLMHNGGRIYFSNNLRTFTPAFDQLQNVTIKDITLATIPEDFRNKSIHWCFQIDINQ